MTADPIVGECDRCGWEVYESEDYLVGEAAPQGGVQHERCYDDDPEPVPPFVPPAAGTR